MVWKKTRLESAACLLMTCVVFHFVRQSFQLLPIAHADDTNHEQSIEERTRVHRLSTSKRTPYDAFVYVNRIPERAQQGETATDLAGRVFGRLANQEGRILLKVPPGMDKNAYLGFRTFMRYEGKSKVGNCVVCHTPAEFTDLASHVVTDNAGPRPTPSLRNLRNRKVDIKQAILKKIEMSRRIRAGEADAVDKAYAVMNIDESDVAQLVAFLNLLNDVTDKQFRQLILDASLLDTSSLLDEVGDCSTTISNINTEKTR